MEIAWALFALSCLMIEIVKSQSVAFPYGVDLLNKAIVVNGTIGTSQIPIEFCFDLISNFSFITDKNKFSKLASLSLSISPIEASTARLKGHLSSDLVSFPSEPPITNERLSFIYSTEEDLKASKGVYFEVYPSCLSLSRCPQSFTQYLYDRNIISSKVISIGKGKLYLGSINPLIKEELLFKIPLIDDEERWSFNLTGLGVGQITPPPHQGEIKDYYQYHISTGYYIAYVTSTMNDILLPESYKDFFLKKYYTIKRKKICDVYKLDRVTEGIGCLNEEIASLPNVSLIFNNTFALLLKPDKLFNKNYKLKKKIGRIKFVKGLYNVVIGNGLIKLVNLVLNEEERYIGFSSDDIPLLKLPKGAARNEAIEGKNGLFHRGCFYTILCICLIGVCELLYMKLTLKR